MTTRQSAQLACRSPPRLSRWRPVVFPDDAGSGATSQRFANAPSDRSRSGLSPPATSTAPGTSVPAPLSGPMVGAAVVTSRSRSRSNVASSAVSSWWSCARHLRANAMASWSTSRWGRVPLSGDAPYVANSASTARAFRHEKRLRPRAHRNMLIQVERVVIVGRGGAGKSTAALRLSELTGLPVIELDKRFWRPDLTPTPRDEWIQKQRELIAPPRWIMDG